MNDCISALEKEDIIGYPTNTIWGLGVDATNKKAIKELYKIKLRILRMGNGKDFKKVAYQS